ncbi:hypothetical protein GRD61_15945 (plasmid) [Clavibacter michiganensis subsp. michiganensis]|nr:hypothetical protein GRD61_15945 [Clavibacter michiganensis subsp. michiganensis]
MPCRSTRSSRRRGRKPRRPARSWPQCERKCGHASSRVPFVYRDPVRTARARRRHALGSAKEEATSERIVIASSHLEPKG